MAASFTFTLLPFNGAFVAELLTQDTSHLLEDALNTDPAYSGRRPIIPR